MPYLVTERLVEFGFIMVSNLVKSLPSYFILNNSSIKNLHSLFIVQLGQFGSVIILSALVINSFNSG